MRWFVRGTAALALFLALALVARDAWLGPLAIRWLQREARASLGAELSVRSVSSRGLETWTLAGVRWSCARPPLLAVEDATIELHFSLHDALVDRAPRLALKVAGSGIRLASAESGEDSGADLPDLDALELDLRDIVLLREEGEPLRVSRFGMAGSLQSMQAHVARLELALATRTGEGGDGARIQLSDAAVDLGLQDWLAMLREARGHLEASSHDAGILRELGGELPLRALDLALDLRAGEASLSGRAELTSGSLVIERGRLALPPGAALEDLELSLGLRAELEDLASLEPLAGRPVAGRWRGSIDVEGPLHAPVGRFTGTGQGLSIGGVALGEFDIDISTDGERAHVERCEISGTELTAVLRGDLVLAPLELVDVGLNVSADRGPLEALLPFPCEHAFVHARLNGPPSAPRGAFEVSTTGVELDWIDIDDAAAHGRVEGDRIEVDRARLTSGESFIETAGTLRQDGEDYAADLEYLTIEWEGARAELERGGHVAFGPGHVSVEGLELSSESAGKHGSARIALQHAAGETHATLQFDDYDAGPLAAPFLPEGLHAGRLRGRVEGSLSETALDAPSVAIDLTLDDWRIGPEWPALDAILAGRYDGRALTLERCEAGFDGDEATHVRGSLRLPIDLAHPLELAAGDRALALEVTTADAVRSLRRAGIEPGLSSTGPCRVSLDLTGEGILRGSLTIDAQRVTMGTEARARACDLEAQLAFGERIEVRRAVFSAPSGTITLDGSVDTALDPKRWQSDRWALFDAPLALSAKVDLAELGWIAGLSGELRRISGQVAGRVGIGGSALRPSLSGSLEWVDGEMRLSSSSSPIRSLSALVSFEGEVVRVERLSGEIGGAPVHLEGTIEPFGPFRRLDLTLQGKSLLLARDAQLRLRADADVRVKGTPSRLVIRGELSLAEGRYVDEISPLEELFRAGRRAKPVQRGRPTLWPDGPLADAELDIHLGGKETFEYSTNLLEASLRPDAWLRGTGAFPVLEGSAIVEAAKLSLPSGDMRLSSGLLTFRPEDPYSPELALRAQIRIQRHEVQAVLTGTLPDVAIVLTSNPPMAQDDLWILVLTGQLPTPRWQDRNSQAMEALAVFLARDSLVRWFGSDSTDESLLERFEIDVGAKTSRTGQPTGRVLFYLRPQRRRSAYATYLSGEIDEYDRVNYAFGIVFRPR